MTALQFAAVATAREQGASWRDIGDALTTDTE